MGIGMRARRDESGIIQAYFEDHVLIAAASSASARGSARARASSSSSLSGLGGTRLVDGRSSWRHGGQSDS